MAKTKVRIIGTLRFSEEGGLRHVAYSGAVDKGGTFRAEKPLPVEYWPEVLPNAHDWPSLGKYPQRPEYDFNEYDWKNRSDWHPAIKEWERAHLAYDAALHADPA